MASSQLQQEAKEAAFQGDVATLQRCFENGLSAMDKKVYLNALQNGDVKTFQVILDAGGDINFTMGYSGSPLISALRHKHQNLLEFLFSRGVDPNMGTYGQRLPPPQRGRAYGADVNEIPFLHVVAFVDYHREGTPLHWAIAGGHAEAVELLLEHHTDLNMVDVEGVSASDRLSEFRNSLGL
ncbi:hypothetical protein ASPWEDRAFT_182899 [Aspergillus wentii DTO 134E9]|uniref:Uncharacterized protein n=1 Tax=Aspergillus wentii DTO 134E9 TaxID=1073089 RepID=A0A1L9RIK3_ASPWE|nr:uncharacterized protein ASPWEDRAFT_182899 [Aspergillus wentii DTO 134E9]OJJ34759.1 hypothetical protein ASPWEDRAFT_182899 [Aspergillus wentii DTO 134E9]